MNPTPVDSTFLPPLGDDRVAAIERDVFARIAAERRRQRQRRRIGWSLGGAAAAVVVVAAVIAPAVLSTLPGAADQSTAVAPVSDGGGTESATIPESAPDGRAASGGAAGEDLSAPGAGREVISTGSANVVVDDVAGAADAIARDAQDRGGYVESLSVGADGSVIGGAEDGSEMLRYPGPVPGDGGWVTVRIPADQLDAAIARLPEVGDVTSSTVSRQDVTDQAVDVRARIAAGEASVTRLTELMAQAADVADLIAAESALAERQAALESDRQQLASLEGQIELSTLTVQLVPRSVPVEADPAGFTDGVAAGWNGLVATLNGIVIALGFLLPWLAVLALAGAVGWGIVRLVRRARRRRPRASAEED
jgi:hypothetical protein